MLGLRLIFAVMLSAGAGGDKAPTGALLGWTSQDSVVAQARDLAQAGHLAEAEKLLQDSPINTGTTAEARRQMAEIIRRIRLEYTLDHAALLARLQRSIPDVTSEELITWREAGQVRTRTLDGQIRYFNSEPANLFRFCPAAQQRLAARNPASTPAVEDARVASRLREHLSEVIAAAKKTHQAEVTPVKHRITYRLTVLGNRPGAKAGSLIRCWLPFPQEYRQQKNVKLLHTAPVEHFVAPTGVDGFPLQGTAQRTVYLEQKIADPHQPTVFEEQFEYTSYAYCPQIRDVDARPLPPDFDRTYLAERPPHIVFTPEIQALARKLAGDETNPLARLRKIYRYLDGKVKWGPEEEYSIIPCFCMKPLTSGKGDCGLQSSLLIALCRAAGLPARWQSGWETKPWSWNMHDWAEVYIAPWGWLPVDQSYGLQGGDDREIDEFYIGHQDAYRLIVNLDYGAPLTPPKTDMRSEPADFQRGEVELDGRNLYFDEWKYDIQFDWTPPR